MELFSPYVPEDFDSFWALAIDEVKNEPFDYSRSLSNDFEFPGFVVETLAFRGMHGSELHGWLAYPEGAKRVPAFVWVPPYGRESLLPNEYGTRDGFCSLSFNLHGLSAFHQEKYVPERGYMAQGAEDPETFVFRTMIQNAMIAARVLQAQPEADENKIAAMGMSQGAGMSIWLGALSPIIRAVAADMPFFGAMRYVLSKQAYRYPLKEISDFAETVPLGLERALNTISYFDTLNLATRCNVATRVTYGTRDPSVKKEQVEAIYEALTGEKELEVFPDWGHDWHPKMVDGNREWLLKHLGTE